MLSKKRFPIWSLTMAYDNPTVQDFKDYFFRDFPFGTDPNVSVLDQDISKAMVQCRSAINQALFDNQER